ncbi:hypothetical protein [Aquimarina algicola]|uniref:Curlin associated repeat-containing protein n=1 Tax=Aquimarina algicola TaxID=2589995 RepID=A0A504JC87_9FLAO|nr:hypothetical protein [Aquimarina algicola]TPN84539.1 hypothetical protein FHK87_16540 [Aquimarina algicola]
MHDIRQILLLLVLISSSLSYAQNTNTEESLILDTDQDRFIALSQVNNLFNQNDAQSNALINDGINAVFIQQIGNNNLVFSNITAESSNVRIVQNGDENRVTINESAREVTKTITQLGTNNAILDVSFNPEISTNLELTQEGNNLNFERFGSNELSNNLKFKMSGESRTIIIRSF